MSFISMIIPSICCANRNSNENVKKENSKFSDNFMFWETQSSKDVLIKLKCVNEFVFNVLENLRGDIKISYVREKKTLSIVISCFQLQELGLDFLYKVVDLMDKQYLLEEIK